MGIYDREYYREERPLFSVGAPRSTLAILIVINVAVWILDSLTTTHWLSDHLSVSGATLASPWLWWQFLTYGFVHSPQDFSHILWNMIGLFLFGRDIEARYGRQEFLRLYLAMVIFGGLVWGLIAQIQGGNPNAIMYGASGAVTGVVLLFALNYPHRTILLFFVVPVPAWVLGVLIVAGNVMGAIGLMSTRTAGGGYVAVSVHIAGAVFALLYFRFGWNLGRLGGGRLSFPSFARRPRLRIHDPGKGGPDLSEEVDRILEKISREGEASLSRKERRTLENASRQYQKRRRQ